MNKLMDTINIANPNIITLYHGTKLDNFTPDHNFKNPKNDYGSGLYMTRDLDKAKQWAMSKYNNTDKGYAYGYEIDLSDLNILDLSKVDSLVWLAILVNNRRLGDKHDYNVLLENRQKLLIEKYGLDLSEYDIIYGYRADDSYYKYATEFITGAIYKEVLDQALMLGKLGKQYCLKTEKAFNRLKRICRHEATDRDRLEFSRIDSLSSVQYQRVKKSVTSGRTIISFIGE